MEVKRFIRKFKVTSPVDSLAKGWKTCAIDGAEMHLVLITPKETPEKQRTSGAEGITLTEVRPVENPIECQSIVDFFKFQTEVSVKHGK
ncbi:MAG: hypothetical protein RIF46_02705 [Cyclobacteriaceae bacterium]